MNFIEEFLKYLTYVILFIILAPVFMLVVTTLGVLIISK